MSVAVNEKNNLEIILKNENPVNLPVLVNNLVDDFVEQGYYKYTILKNKIIYKLKELFPENNTLTNERSKIFIGKIIKSNKNWQKKTAEGIPEDIKVGELKKLRLDLKIFVKEIINERVEQKTPINDIIDEVFVDFSKRPGWISDSDFKEEIKKKVVFYNTLLSGSSIETGGPKDNPFSGGKRKRKRTKRKRTRRKRTKKTRKKRRRKRTKSKRRRSR